MFKNLKVSMKIGGGFGTVLILLSITLLVSALSFNTAEEGIKTYRKLAQHSNLIGDLQTNMLQVRMDAKNYLLTRSENNLTQYQHFLARVKQDWQQLKNVITDSKQLSILSKMNSELKHYDTTFGDTVHLIKEQNLILDKKLAHIEKDLTANVNDFVDFSDGWNDPQITIHAMQLKDKILNGRIYIGRFLQSSSEKDYRISLVYMGSDVNTEINGLTPLLNTGIQKKMLAQVVEKHKIYMENVDKIHKLILKRDDVVKNSLNKIGPEISHQIQTLKTEIIKTQDTLGPELDSNIDHRFHFVVTLSFIAIIIGIVAAYLITTAITKPIHKAVDAAHQLAHGDLTVKVGNTGKDETGKLLDAVQETANYLKEMMSTISSASHQLASASEELAEVTEQSARGISQQETETEMVATAINQMAATIHNVADNAAKASEAANQADTEANTGAQVVEQTITAINSLSDSVNNSSDKLGEVQQEVTDINKILEVIRDIAERTNLLALNAAIEAARAGEHGRGFAVVADEVRLLASRTQGSTDEIQNIIEQLQASTKNTVEVMAKGKALADTCVAQSGKTEGALKAINGTIRIINDMNVQIASASEQQSSVAETINKNIMNVKFIAGENANASAQTQNSTAEIAKLAERLNQMVDQFKVA
ncbi:HAMP domain-containing methyl-accepting chemotaxis protein [Vibrio salinus]|uniref:HAMP domain-containing methyl-accepting chemotaxis protein n=1 Tax=Vibrio salinus TaxID=2899784 RepID=UPI001E3A76B1|nr:methyl-accepting chemotaxis protein [Vibrio salinus]MCE0493132.1 methyl-accepting chemotaxis protein [Vibrio salinus]